MVSALVRGWLQIVQIEVLQCSDAFMVAKGCIHKGIFSEQGLWTSYETGKGFAADLAGLTSIEDGSLTKYV